VRFTNKGPKGKERKEREEQRWSHDQKNKVQETSRQRACCGTGPVSVVPLHYSAGQPQTKRHMSLGQMNIGSIADK